jgi:hypothetical protein
MADNNKSDGVIQKAESIVKANPLIFLIALVITIIIIIILVAKQQGYLAKLGIGETKPKEKDDGGDTKVEELVDSIKKKQDKAAK